MRARLWTRRFLGLLILEIFILLLIVRFFGLSYPDDDLLPKYYLLANSPRIFFAGDSRAERQLEPDYAAEILHINREQIANIANSSGDPLQVLSLIKKHPDVFREAIVILSISANQLNDGAKDSGYFTDKMISGLSFRQQIEIFYPNNLKTLTKYYTNNTRTNLNNLFGIAKTEKRYAATNGFLKVEGKLDPSSITANYIGHLAWYRDFSADGIKNILVRDSLLEIKSRVRYLLVFAAPFAPSYLEAIKNHEMYDFELRFQASINEICKSAGISSLTYLSIPGLTDDNFYDIAHLNGEGARLFTAIILSDFAVAEKLGLNN